MQRTKIEYLTHTWNPLAMRCTRMSAGCDNCWHLRMADRLEGVFAKKGDGLRAQAYGGFGPWLNQDELAAPLKLRKPAVIGVQFMGDLFHESVTNEQIAAVFGVMAACPQHTFCVLTKRPKRMAEWFRWIHQCGAMVPFLVGEEIPDGASGEAAACVMSNTIDPALTPIEPVAFCAGIKQPWPLPNVMLGVSVEDTADERIPLLFDTPAAKWFVSVEPMLSNILLDNGYESWLTCHADDGYRESNDGACCLSHSETGDCFRGIDWVICGAETGLGKRPMDLNWARSLRDQCVAAGVPFFFKVDSNGNHELDGRTWEQMPDGVRL